MLLFLLFILRVNGFKRKIDNKFLTNNIYFERDDWNHGEVEWEFTEKSYMNKFNISYKEYEYKKQNKVVVLKKKKSLSLE